MTEQKRTKRGIGVKAFSTLLCLMIAFLILVGTALFGVNQLLSKPDSWMGSTGEAVLRAQTAISNAAGKLPFSPETALAFYPEERLTALAEESRSWMLSLLTEQPEQMPDYSADGLTEAILQDPLFLEEGPQTQRRIHARDEGTYAVESAVTRALLPIRASLIAQAREHVPQRWVRLLGIVPQKGPLYSALAVLGCCLLLLALWYKRPSAAFSRIGAALAAGGIGIGTWLFLFWLLNLPMKVALMNPELAQTVRRMTDGYTRFSLLCTGGLLVVGLLIFLLFRGRAGRGDEA